MFKLCSICTWSKYDSNHGFSLPLNVATDKGDLVLMVSVGLS